MNGDADEQKLVKLYMELTGTSEPGARSVFMFVCPENAKAAEAPTELVLRSVPAEQEPAAVPSPSGETVRPSAGRLVPRGTIAGA